MPVFVCSASDMCQNPLHWKPLRGFCFFNFTDHSPCSFLSFENATCIGFKQNWFLQSLFYSYPSAFEYFYLFSFSNFIALFISAHDIYKTYCFCSPFIQVSTYFLGNYNKKLTFHQFLLPLSLRLQRKKRFQRV